MAHNHTTNKNRPLRTRPVSGAAFTLIELLVVVAIIGLLIALLSPSLGRAIESARSVACASNLRQCGMGMQLFMYNNDGLFPIGDKTRSGRGATQHYQIAEYLYPGVTGQARYELVDDPNTLFVCPSHGRLMEEGTLAYDRTWYFRTSPGGLLDQDPGKEHFPYIWINRPSRVLVWTEAWGQIHRPDISFHRLSPRHNGRLNVLFADFHVESFTPEEICVENSPVLWDWRL